AQRSAAAAKEIKTLIGDSVAQVNAGNVLVSEAGTTMMNVVDSVRQVNDIMTEIMAASEEQRAGIEQVNVAMAQMDVATQQNAALVEESFAAAASMQEQATELAREVSLFRLDGRAMDSARARARDTAAPVRRAPPRLAPRQQANREAFQETEFEGR
ncbi:MAG: methyl-accepting chemotaxis protein, partial [Massilia sp.]